MKNSETTDISTLKVAMTMVRGFMEGYFAGIIDQTVKEAKEKSSPKSVKTALATYYESIAPNFVNVVFPQFIAMNFDSYADAIADFEAHHLSKDTPLKLLLRYSCGSKEMYGHVVEQYKEQMGILMSGKVQSAKDFLTAFAGMQEEAAAFRAVAVEKAIRLAVRATLHGYVSGLKQAMPHQLKVNQATVIRIIPNVMTCLLHSEPIDPWTDVDTIALDGVYRLATVNEANYDTAIEEMNQAYDDLVADEQKDEL